MSKSKLGRVQLKIMRVLWTLGRANARVITDALNEDAGAAGGPIAHSTVQTLLRKLEEKGSIAHDVEHRTFIFYPLVEEDSVTRSATRELVERVFGGDAAGLVAYLLKEERIPSKELSQLRQLIDEKSTKRGRKS
jgi:BlaI family penicillinase repressor